MIKDFLQELRTQRWDDHRYYHHSRINQSLHFVSAASFLFAYAMLFIDPMVSALVGWLVSMTSRQAGHFFFEPRGYDHVNHATHEHKEEIKVGYNLQRKVVLMAIWALSPLVLYFDPTLFGLFTPWTSSADFMRQVAKVWLVVGAVLQLGTYFCTAVILKLGLRRAATPVRMRSLVPLGLVKLFIDQVVPTGGIAGTVLIIKALQRRGVPVALSTAAVVVSLLGFYLAYAVSVLLCLVIFWWRAHLSPVILSAVTIASLAPLATACSSAVDDGADHVDDTSQAISRIIDVFPAEQQSQVRTQLSAALTAIVYQRLLPRVGGGLVGAFEVLVANSPVRNLIKDAKTHQLRNSLVTGQRDGMMTLEQSMSALIQAGLATYDDAVARSLYPKDIELAPRQRIGVA